jgi:hypothetical protein
VVVGIYTNTGKFPFYGRVFDSGFSFEASGIAGERDK